MFAIGPEICPPGACVDREFCQLEYDRIGQDLIANEEMGEGRVSLYVGVWTAALAGVGWMATTDAAAHSKFVPALVLGAVVLGGVALVTTARVRKRNYHTDKLVDALERLRYLLLRENDANRHLMCLALPWAKECRAMKAGAPANECDGLPKAKKARKAFQFKPPGLLELLFLINATIPCLIAVAAWHGRTLHPDWCIHLVGGLAAVVVLLAQVLYAWRSNGREHGRRVSQAELFNEAIGAGPPRRE